MPMAPMGSVKRTKEIALNRIRAARIRLQIQEQLLMAGPAEPQATADGISPIIYFDKRGEGGALRGVYVAVRYRPDGRWALAGPGMREPQFPTNPVKWEDLVQFAVLGETEIPTFWRADTWDAIDFTEDEGIDIDEDENNPEF